jgi:hypothetical protein
MPYMLVISDPDVLLAFSQCAKFPDRHSFLQAKSGLIPKLVGLLKSQRLVNLVSA